MKLIDDPMTIKNAQYVNNSVTNEKESINATIDNQLMTVPINLDNRHYAEILRQVEEGTLTIKEAD
tara:strand:+ start:1238 stop:1435 length:198 start_codon:yes stop_codon:yes gene_type:complete